MKINIFFLIKLNKVNNFLPKKNLISLVHNKDFFLQNVQVMDNFNKLPIKISTPFNFNTKLPNVKLTNFFLSKSLTKIKLFKSFKQSLKKNLFTFLNKFLLFFLESFFKTKLILNIKKGTNKLPIKQIGQRKFFIKYFKKNLKISKQIIGVIYYSLILKDSSIFVNFFRKTLERSSIKNHKKIFLGFRKLMKDVFKPLFNYLGILGVLFNIKGKIGVSGSAKKRRYFFYFGKHSLTTRTTKLDIKHTPVWTFTGTLGFTFLIFF